MSKCDINDLTIGQVRELTAFAGGGSEHVPVLAPGKAYFFFGIPLYRLGRVVRQVGKWVEVTDAGWVADTGRMSEAFKTGDVDEFEPIPGTLRINLDACVDVAEWPFEIPTEAK